MRAIGVERIIVSASVPIRQTDQSLFAAMLLGDNPVLLKQLNEISQRKRKHLGFIQTMKNDKPGKERRWPASLEKQLTHVIRRHVDATTYEARERLALADTRLATATTNAEGESIMDATVRVHRSEKAIAMSTNAGDERAFFKAAVPEIEELITKYGATAMLSALLPQIVDICCKMRGYKANVTEHRIIIAGEWVPDDVVEVFGTSRAKEPATV